MNNNEHFAEWRMALARYFTPMKLEVLMQASVEYEHICRQKSNTAGAGKERETALEEIAPRVNV